ncbi:transmembrane protein 107-like isoform X2 [Anas platyrhynchos]|uniref:transmembrane protein 107-like isoform X2 n=1 Tax=Anas platyrhynchos TaxID=8839 RepID=UPI003AF1E40C
MIPLWAVALARFLTLMSHLVALGRVAWARDTPVRASLPLEFSAEEYARVNTELLCALGLAAGLLAIEFGGFFAGVSRFHRLQGMFSLRFHAAASFTLYYALRKCWEVRGFWLLLGLYSVPPAITELLLLVVAALGRRGNL